jgi:hypothetical protein
MMSAVLTLPLFHHHYHHHYHYFCLQVGITGKHTGHTGSIVFFECIGADYLCCAPDRVPVAKVAAAQARIQTDMSKHYAGPSVTNKGGHCCYPFLCTEKTGLQPAYKMS